MESVDERADVAASRAALADAPDSSAAYLDLVAALTAQADAEPDPDNRAGQADEPVELLRAAVALADENLPVTLARLASLLYWLYWRCTARAEQDAPAGDIAADRDEGIAHFDRLWRMAVEADAVPDVAPWAHGIIWPTGYDHAQRLVVLFGDRCASGVLNGKPDFAVDLDDEYGAVWLNGILVHHRARVMPPRKSG